MSIHDRGAPKPAAKIARSPRGYAREGASYAGDASCSRVTSAAAHGCAARRCRRHGRKPTRAARSVEPLRLAVRTRRVGARAQVADAKRGAGLGEEARSVTDPVVGEHLRIAPPSSRNRPSRRAVTRGTDPSSSQHLAVGHPRAVVDGHVYILPAASRCVSVRVPVMRWPTRRIRPAFSRPGATTPGRARVASLGRATRQWLEPCLEEAQVAWFVGHPEPAGRFALVEHGRR